jgi:ribosomal protein L44E
MFTKEVREKMSKAKIGKPPANKGIPRPEMRGNKFAFLGDKAKPDTGRKRAQEKFKQILPCQKCGKTKQIIRHHKDENTLNNKKSNIMFLCRSCHINHHRQKLTNARFYKV